MKDFIQKYFKFQENNTNFKKEISGVMFVILTLIKVREKFINSIPGFYVPSPFDNTYFSKIIF